MKSLRKFLLWLVAVFVLLFLAGEITLRLKGRTAFHPVIKNTVTQPGGWFFMEDPLLGFRPRPGDLKITLDEKLTFATSHDRLGRRIPASGYKKDSSKKEIWFFGCSFTYGWGVNESESFVGFLRKAFPEYEFINFASPGYGTVQALEQLKLALSSSTPPEKIIYGYGGFHNQRNVCGRTWKRALHGQKMMEGIRYPYMRRGESGDLVKGWSDLVYQPRALTQYSAFLNFIQEQSDIYDESSLDAEGVTKDIIFEMNKRIKEANSELLVAGIWKNEGTTRMIQSLTSAGVNASDVSVELTDDLILFPGEHHPNAKAHKILAGKIEDVLKK